MSPCSRPGRRRARAWDAWAARVIVALATVPPPGRDGDEFLARVADAANQPLPNESVVL
jgi:hypothetical protein